jgi:hypothetical protein
MTIELIVLNKGEPGRISNEQCAGQIIGTPLVFSREIDPQSLDNSDFQIKTQKGDVLVLNLCHRRVVVSFSSPSIMFNSLWILLQSSPNPTIFDGVKRDLQLNRTFNKFWFFDKSRDL